MLCLHPHPLNGRRTLPLLPRPHRKRPSRAAGSFNVKSFGRRQAYESPRGTNPRAAGAALWGFRILAGGDTVSTAAR